MIHRSACLLLFLLSLLFLLGPELLSAQARREAILVLAQPPVIEQFLAIYPERPLGRHHLRSPECAARMERLRGLKARLANAVRTAGAEVVGTTELVLNTLLVRATAEQLAALRNLPGVESAEFARQYTLLLESAVPLLKVDEAWTHPAIGGEENAGLGIKIGVIDSGIDHTHPMFQDAQLSPPAGFPKGDTTLTNNKVIVARNFPNESSAADTVGHGTFVAGIAAGLRAQAPQASISGVAPKAFLGNYRATDDDGSASGTRVLAAIDAAVLDGMDIINLSLGARGTLPPTLDPFFEAIGNATAAGILVVAAAGNDGPGVRTVASPAILPQVLAVGSTTNARRFLATVGVTAAEPVPPSLAEIQALPGNDPEQTGPFGPAPLADVATLDPSGLACLPSAETPSGISLPPNSLQGKMALIQRGICAFREKVQNVAGAGAVGAVIYNNIPGSEPLLMDTSGNQIPSMSIGNEDGLALSDFLAGGGQAQVSFDPQLVAWPGEPDVLVSSSARGPAPDLTVKPDLVAPGDFILSSTQNLNPLGDMFSSTRFLVSSGTSFATPMAVGAAALVRQVHPSYQPKQVKSALVNTALPVTAIEDGAPVSAQNIGAGRLNVLAALTTPVVADPVSLSFGARAPRSTFQDSQLLQITNTGDASDTFTLTVVPRQTDPNVTVQLDRTALALSPNQSAEVKVTMSNTGLVQTVVEGQVKVQSQGSGDSIHVPYWVTFVVPEVNAGGVVNGADFQGDAGLAPGSIVSIFGVALASTTAGAAALPLPAELGGSRVELDGVPMPLFFSSVGQVNAQIPFELAPNATVFGTVRVDGIRSQPFQVPLSAFNPALFSLSEDGLGPGAILHANGALVSADNAAQAGETVLLFGTGLGTVTNPPDTGQAASANPLSKTMTTPTVTIGGREAPVEFSGLAPNFVGLYQVNVVIPSGLPPGEHPVQLTIGGVSGNAVTISVR